MPKVRRSKKPPPEGWELIEPTLDELDQKMREGKKNCFINNVNPQLYITHIQDVKKTCFSYSRNRVP